MKLVNELRRNPISGTITIVSTIRRFRPKEYEAKSGKVVCPFCPGNEFLTPPAIVLVKRGGEYVIERDSEERRVRNWVARVFPNKYPALTVKPPQVTEPVFEEAYGYHEVLVETPKHVPDIHLAPREDIADALWLGFHRIHELLADDRVQCVVMIKNRGAQAGASIIHTHSQIFALPLTPPRIAVEVEIFRVGNKPLCRYLSDELSKERRVVFRGEHFVVIAIVAPRIPYELWVVPYKHRARPLDLSYDELVELATILQNITKVYTEVLKFDSYNMWLHMAPKGVDEYHWHIEVAPSLPTWGGLEKSSDVYIIDVPPEEAAEIIKKHFTLR